MLVKSSFFFLFVAVGWLDLVSATYAMLPEVTVTRLDGNPDTEEIDPVIDERTFTSAGIAGSHVHSNLNQEKRGKAFKNINGPPQLPECNETMGSKSKINLG